MQQFSPLKSQSPRRYQQLSVVLILSLVSASSGLVRPAGSTSSLSRYSAVGTTRLYDVDGSSEMDKNALFPKENTDNESKQSSFGDVMPMKRPASAASSEFGDVVSLQRPSTSSASTFAVASDSSPLIAMGGAVAEQSEDPSNTLAMQKKRNIGIGTISILLAISNYLWQFAHPITPVQLLFSMEQNSAPVTLIGTNNRPTVVDFWAPWCENCKVMAPTLKSLEQEYGDRINFVMINGDKSESWNMIEAFGVDAIPHLALVSANGDVETALIGPIPKHIMEQDLDVLLANAAQQTTSAKRELPFQMLDVFANRPEQRRVHFEETTTNK